MIKMTFENGTEIMVDINNINHVEVISNRRSRRIDAHRVVDFMDINSWLCDNGRQPLDEYTSQEAVRVRKEYIGHTLKTVVDYFNK